MTIETEIIDVGNSLIINNDRQMWLPRFCMPELLCTEIPTEADLVTQMLTQKFPLGTKVVERDGIWRLCKAGATMTDYAFLKGNSLIVPGSGGNSATPDTGFEGAAYEAAAAGATAIKIADTVATKNLYQGGLLTIYNDTDHFYDSYEIIGNDVTNATYTIIYIAPPGLKKALTTGYGIDAYLSPYASIKGYAACGAYASALGYAQYPVTTGYFFWLKTAGRISGITGASTWPGQTAYQRDVYCNTDGSLIGITSGTYLYQRVGFLMFRTASNYGDNTIMLQLDQ
jgi:hypothetical protein